jgi:hypothetical protein
LKRNIGKEANGKIGLRKTPCRSLVQRSRKTHQQTGGGGIFSRTDPDQGQSSLRRRGERAFRHRPIPVRLGQTIFGLDKKEAARWKKAVRPVIEEYIDNMNKKGFNGKEIVDFTESALQKYQK